MFTARQRTPFLALHVLRQQLLARSWPCMADLRHSFYFVQLMKFVRLQLSFHCSVGVLGIFFLFFGGWYSFDHLTWTANSHRERRNVLCNNGACSNSTPLTNRHSRENHDIAANPTVITNLDRVTKLDILPSGQNTGLMSSGVDADVWAHLNAIPNNHQGRVKNTKAAIGLSEHVQDTCHVETNAKS